MGDTKDRVLLSEGLIFLEGVLGQLAEPSKTLSYLRLPWFRSWVRFLPVIFYPVAIFTCVAVITSDQVLLHEMLVNDQGGLVGEELESAQLRAESIQMGLMSWPFIATNAFVVATKACISLCCMIGGQYLLFRLECEHPVDKIIALHALFLASSILVVGELMNFLIRIATRDVNSTMSLMIILHPICGINTWVPLMRNIDIFVIWYLASSGYSIGRLSAGDPTIHIVTQFFFYGLIVLAAQIFGLEFTVVP